jgi:hydroxymethylglutaryl-CoA lyase
MGDYVRITDVAPRDGLQNEPGVIPTQEKVELVRLLCETGVDEVEVTSFVSPKWVPQLGDAAELLDALRGLLDSGSPLLSALVPNERGLQGVLDANARAKRLLVAKASLFTAASETFSKRNTNATIAESIERFKPVILAAKQAGLRIRGYVSCIVACPFEGPIAPHAVVHVSEQLINAGIDELDLGDTIGAGTPETISAVLKEVSRIHALTDPESFTLHLHDTHGRAADCVKSALDLGVRSFDGSVAGLGGCPYASTPTTRAPGNISTQTLIRTIHNAGSSTNVDMAKLEEAGRFAMKIVTAARLRASQGSPPAEPRP